MKIVKYIGDPNDNLSGPMLLSVKGKTYRKGEDTTVTDEREKHLRGHNHFVTESGPWPEPTTDDEVDAVDENVAPHTEEECKSILDERGVKYKNKDTLEVLVDRVEKTGGFPVVEQQ